MFPEETLETNPLRERRKLISELPPSNVKCCREDTLGQAALPGWCTVYPHITFGYRNPRTHDSILQCIISAFHWNTETVNIQLHLWAGIAHIALTLWILRQPFFLQSSPEGKVASLVGGIGSVICEFSSAAAHTFHILSPVANVAMWRLDYLAMVFVFYGSSWTGAWYLFGVFNRPVFYAVQALSALIAIACLHQIWVHERFTLVNVFALWAFVPFTLWMLAECYFFGKDNEPQIPIMREACTWLLLCSLTSIVGGVFYAFKFPENVWNPKGTLNFVGNSHNILHVFVVAACTTGILSTFPIARYEAIVWNSR